MFWQPLLALSCQALSLCLLVATAKQEGVPVFMGCSEGVHVDKDRVARSTLRPGTQAASASLQHLHRPGISSAQAARARLAGGSPGTVLAAGQTGVPRFRC